MRRRFLEPDVVQDSCHMRGGFLICGAWLVVPGRFVADNLGLDFSGEVGTNLITECGVLFGGGRAICSRIYEFPLGSYAD